MLTLYINTLFWLIIGLLTNTLNSGNKSRDLFKLMDGYFADVSATEISELLKLNSIEVIMIAISPSYFRDNAVVRILVADYLVMHFSLSLYIYMLDIER